MPGIIGNRFQDMSWRMVSFTTSILLLFCSSLDSAVTDTDDIAPLVFLDSKDKYFPSDLATHLKNTHAEVNFKSVEGAPEILTLENLGSLNKSGGANVYLTSNEDVTTLPTFLTAHPPDPKTLATTDAKVAQSSSSIRVMALLMPFICTFILSIRGLRLQVMS